jgi:uncharacterized repeat protein (TIGR01451 family)
MERVLQVARALPPPQDAPHATREESNTVSRFMRPIARSALALSLALVGAECPTPFDGRIAGSVVVEGVGLQGITVTLVGEGNTTTTDASGNYSFSALNEGAYSVEISGFPADVTFSTTVQEAAITNEDKEVSADFDGVYVRTSAIVGNVSVTEVGPLELVTVTLSTEPPSSTTTGSEGQYSFTDLRAGTYTVEISGFAPQYTFEVTSKSVSLETGTTEDVDFTGTLPGIGLEFSKSFTPSVIGLGSVSTLRFDINNLGPSAASDLAFTDVLPAGVVIATPANTVSACAGGVLSAPDGASTISFTGGGIDAVQGCSITVDVVGMAVGTHTNVSGDLTSSAGNGGSASADLTVLAPPELQKEFTDDPVWDGGTVTLQFSLTNTSSDRSLTDVAFTDDLDSTLSGLAATGLPAVDVCGGTLSGTSTLAFSGGSLSADATCTFNVTLSVPSGAPAGTYPNATSEVTGDLGGVGVVGDPATDDLNVTAAQKVLGLRQLPGQFITAPGGQPVANVDVTVSLWSGDGTGGVVVSSGNGLQGECLGVDIFNTVTSEILAHYISLTSGGCSALELPSDMLDGSKVLLNDGNEVQVALGALPIDDFEVFVGFFEGVVATETFVPDRTFNTTFVDDLLGADWVLTTAGLHQIIAASALDPVATPPAGAGGICTPGATTLCLNNGRFMIGVEWDTGSGASTGTVASAAADSGLFFFFDDGRSDFLVTLLNGCSINSRFWIFAAASSDVEYTLTVTDTATNQTRSYFNPLGSPSPAITDTSAFATCP